MGASGKTDTGQRTRSKSLGFDSQYCLPVEISSRLLFLYCVCLLNSNLCTAYGYEIASVMFLGEEKVNSQLYVTTDHVRP